MKIFSLDRLTGDTTVAERLGYAGLIPFVVCCLLIVMGHGAMRQIAVQALVGYGAVILSFMGAVHWGRAMFDDAGFEEKRRTFLFSVVPALFGWLCLILNSRVALIVLGICFAALYLYDRDRLGQRPSMTWYLRLRIRLSLVVVIVLLLAALAL